MVKEKLAQIKKGDLSAVENVQEFLDKIKEDKFNVFLHVNENAIKEAEEVDKKIKAGVSGKLAGLGIAIKANINVKDLPISCASKTLENYKGTFDADVIEKIKKEDGIIIGIVNCDEFASGSSGETSAFGPTENPRVPGKIAGGSSSGSAASVAADYCDIALGSDTGGSIRIPASHCGVVGIKPSYGRVSRYGLIDLSMSLDQIGPLSRDVFGSALMMEIISGKSSYDGTTFEKEIDHYSKFNETKKLKIGISKKFFELCNDGKIVDMIKEQIEKLRKELDGVMVDIDLKYIDLAIQTYYPIVYVEFYSGTRKFDGRRFGEKIEDSCGEEVLRRILGGEEISKSEFEGTYYRKALNVKTLIKKDFDKAFEECDVILSPVSPKLPHNIGDKLDPKSMYAYDAFTIPANLAGICAGVVPVGEIEGCPVGMQVMANSFEEKLMFDVLHSIEQMNK